MATIDGKVKKGLMVNSLFLNWGDRLELKHPGRTLPKKLFGGALVVEADGSTTCLFLGRATKWKFFLPQLNL